MDVKQRKKTKQNTVKLFFITVRMYTGVLHWYCDKLLRLRHIQTHPLSGKKLLNDKMHRPR